MSEICCMLSLVPKRVKHSVAGSGSKKTAEAGKVQLTRNLYKMTHV